VGSERFAVVRVAFPFTDREAVRNRPALVISDGVAFKLPAGHSVMATITSEENPPGRWIAVSRTSLQPDCLPPAS
jgi:mRNA interferase MazF